MLEENASAIFLAEMSLKYSYYTGDQPMNSLQWKNIGNENSLQWKVCNENNEIFSIKIHNSPIFKREFGSFKSFSAKKMH